jgi:CheY-like chemotaxis protein
MLRMGIARSLRQLGIGQIEEAVDGQHALERLKQEEFDLMLLDMEMPQMNGLAVLARMQANSELRNLPVIVISGGESIDEVVACIEMGAEDYLPKPFSQVPLRARLTSSLEKKDCAIWKSSSETAGIPTPQADSGTGKIRATSAQHPAACNFRAAQGWRTTLRRQPRQCFCLICRPGGFYKALPGHDRQAIR